MRLSDYVADFFVKKGCEHVFMVTGGGAMHLNDSLGKSDLTCVFNHHEQACAIAAEGYYRVSNKVPLVNVTSGPGGTNAITGVYGAWVDSASMIVISGQVKRETMVGYYPDLNLRQLGDQELDIIPLVDSITKYAVTVWDKNQIRYVLEKAWFEVTNGRPGPVWIDIPLDIQGAQIDPETLVGFEVVQHKNAQTKQRLVTQAKEVFSKIKNSKRPLLYLGTGVHISGQKENVLNFSRKHNIPVVTAWNNNDLVPDSHPCYVGRPGTVGDRAGNFAVQASDCLVVLGSRLNIRQISYNWENFAPNAHVIMVDIDSNELFKPTLNVDFPINADLKNFMACLPGGEQPIGNEEWLNWCIERRDKYKMANEEHLPEKSNAVNPYRFMHELSKYLSEDQITITGDGTACVASFQAMQVKENQRLFTNSGCASMGYDVPASIGAYYASNRTVNCLAGDGSIMMNIQELATIAGNKIPIKIFVLNNNGYHSIRQTQNNYFPSGKMGFQPDNGVKLPDFEKIAYGYSLPYFAVKELGAVEQVYKEIQRCEGPVLCEVFLDVEQEFMPKLSSRKLEDGTMVSATLEDMYPFLPEDEMLKNRV
ncbi:thiamine pyrophosphate-binding protein [Hydrogenovibrio kuenenii]|uniref:thiamine pyrophosphate-binding protein n=1 Tax=Hydrogenovibrio kuenenii TaxID=63658 RepID=UPI000465B786|nr:thiamine pyrophosphate-binding protein [Hydrogenovibrio kuenenii]